MAAAEIHFKIADLDVVKETLKTASEKIETMHRILSTLFATEVSDIRPCRQCGKPVLHMEHLTMEEAKALEAEVRALINIPANHPDEV